MAGDVCFVLKKHNGQERRYVCLHLASKYIDGERYDLCIHLVKVTDQNADAMVNVFESTDRHGWKHESGYTKLSYLNVFEIEGKYNIGKLGEITRTRLDDVYIDIYESRMGDLLRGYLRHTNDAQGFWRGLSSIGG
jgi:hypothetical protein